MKRLTAYLSAAVVCAGALLWHQADDPSADARAFYSEIAHYMRTNNGKVPKIRRRPNDWFYTQRAYPETVIPQKAVRQAFDAARIKVAEAAALKSPSVVTWSQAGPTNIPGRIPDLAVPESQPNTIYAATAAGGLFKTTDLGANWTPIFDEVGPQSIGAVAVHPDNPNIVYVGTGEANAANDTYDGTGVYKSEDGGATWTLIGLPNSFRIGRIVIDPMRPESVYVAVTGRLFGTNPDRGLYRTQNGGSTWEQLLYVTDSTGCIDVALHPSTGTVFAAMWERWRDIRERRVGGLTSALYRSTDFGASWVNLNESLFPGFGLPEPADTLGRIGVSVDPQSNTVYAVFVNHPGRFMGMYKSTDLGFAWTQTTDAILEGSLGGFGWYFGQVRVAPGNPLIAYSLGVSLYKTSDGGFSWSSTGAGTHVDHHALYILPSDHDQVYDGGDGGANHSSTGGSSWSNLANMPNTQFYGITIDPHDPLRLYGGTQDNGTLRTPTGASNNWQNINGGDGFYVVVSHADPDVIYAEYQWGWLRRSTNGGGSFSTKLNGMDYGNERHNWNTPFVMDPSDANVLYYGSNILYKTTDGADNWFAVSGDLTNGPDPGNLTFGTITTITVSPLNAQVIYVGTDDANVWVTQNGGGSWQSINAGLPNLWVTRVAADPLDAATAYVTFSGYKEGSYLPHIFRTTDYGQNWDDITGDLMGTPINDVIPDPQLDSTLYIGTDFGVYVTSDLGQSWTPLGTGMPISPVHDLDFHDAGRTLVAGTHGRSMFKTTLTISVCACDCHADPECDLETNVFDVVHAVAVGLRNDPDIPDPNPACPYNTTDVDCDNDTDIFDVVRLVNVAFRNEDPAVNFCDPCAP